MLFIPDSPRRLLYNGKEDKARKARAFINGIPESSPEVDTLLRDIEIGIAMENEGGKAGWKDLLGKEIRSRVIHGMVVRTRFSCLLRHPSPPRSTSK
jgi:SP family sugar:H+ symporter-like MFS transporter